MYYKVQYLVGSSLLLLNPIHFTYFLFCLYWNHIWWSYIH